MAKIVPFRKANPGAPSPAPDPYAGEWIPMAGILQRVHRQAQRRAAWRRRVRIVVGLVGAFLLGLGLGGVWR